MFVDFTLLATNETRWINNFPKLKVDSKRVSAWYEVIESGEEDHIMYRMFVDGVSFLVKENPSSNISPTALNG